MYKSLTRWTTAVVLLATAVSAPAAPNRLAAVLAGRDENAKCKAVLAARKTALTAEFVITLAARERMDMPVMLAGGVYLETQPFVPQQTTMVVKALAGRRGQRGRAATFAAFSPSMPQIVEELIAARSTAEHQLAATILAIYARSLSVPSADNRATAIDPEAPPQRDRPNRPAAAPARRGQPIPHVDIEPLLAQLLPSRDPLVRELSTLAAAYARLDGLGEAVERATNGAAELEAVGQFYRTRVDQPLDAETIETLLRRPFRAPAVLTRLTPMLSNYEIRGCHLIYACQAVAASPDPRYLDLLHPLLTHDDLRVRIEAAWAIEQIGATQSLPSLLEALADEPPWPVKIALLSAVGAAPHADSIEPLIELLEAETGRFRQDVNYALASIVGKQHGQTADEWGAWLQEHGAAFRVDPAATRAFREELAVRDMKVPVIGGFYGVEIISDRVVFVLDTSKSMQGQKITSLKAAMDATLLELRGEIRFNIVAFGGVMHMLPPGQLIHSGYAREVSKVVQDLSLSGCTRSYDALERGISFAEVDTVIFLSDGAPVAGQMEHWDRIIRGIDLLDRYRRVAIDTVYFSRAAAKPGGRGKGGGNARAMSLLAERNVGHMSRPE